MIEQKSKFHVGRKKGGVIYIIIGERILSCYLVSRLLGVAGGGGLRYVIELHSAQDAFPADWAILDFARTRDACDDVAAVIEGRIGRLVPADATHALLFLGVLPVCDALAEFLVVFPAADVRVTRGGLDECARALLLVVDPFAVVGVAVLECVEAVAVASAEAEGAGVGCSGVVDAGAVAVAVAVADLAFVVFIGEVRVGDVAIEFVGEVAGEGAVGKEGLGVCWEGFGSERRALVRSDGEGGDDDCGVVEVELGEGAAVLERSRCDDFFFLPELNLLLVFHRLTKKFYHGLIHTS